MGYYTHYKLKIHGLEKSEMSVEQAKSILNNSDSLESAIKEIVRKQSEGTLEHVLGTLFEITGYHIFDYVEDGVAIMEESSTWYTHEEDLRELSKIHSNLLFELEGVGEDVDDIWKKYFKNGKMQICNAKIIFSPYDETKLQ